MALTLDGTNGIVSSGSITTQSATGVIFSDSSNQGAAASPFSLKNRIINGDMAIDQRNNGASLSVGVSSQVYSLDRYTILPFGSGCTVQRVAGISGFQYALRVTGAAGNSQIQIGQKIESANTYDLINQNVTISFYAQSSTAKTQTLFIIYPNSTDSWPGGYSNIASTSFNITTSPQRFSFTFNAGANAGNGMGILFADTAYLAGQTLTITGVQLERNTTATPFEWLPYSTELALCQRYCPVFTMGSSATNDLYRGFAATATLSDYSLALPVTPRVPPTGITTSGTFGVGNGAAGANATAVAFLGGGNSTLNVRVTTTAGSPTLSQGVGAAFYGSSSGVIICNGCEL